LTHLSRRTVLRAAGAMIALPFLESMLPGKTLWTPTASAASRAALAAPPTRMMFVFLPNGVDITAWPGSATGALTQHAGQFSVLRNLCHRNAQALGDGPGDHARSSACFLTGAHPRKTSGGDISAGISVDQVAAAQLAGITRMDSLELGGEPSMSAGSCDSGYSCAYSANISWRGPHSPNAKEHNPRRVFERLFSAGPEGETAVDRTQRLRMRTSILDGVRAQASALQSKLGINDRRKLDEYLDGIRTIERRIAHISRDDGKTSRRDSRAPAIKQPTDSPADFAERITLLSDLAVLSMTMDQTRIVTLMLANEGSNRAYPEIGVNDGHHDVSHHGQDATKLKKFAAINAWQGERLAYLLGAMQARDEHGARLLDNTMVVYGGAIADGNSHNHDDLPIILAGGSSLGIQHTPRRSFAPGTPMCNLFVTMLAKMGVKADRFGDSTESLSLAI